MSDKLQRWIEYSKSFPTTGKAALAIVERDGLILSISRENDLEDWTLPGGKLEPGEDWLTALVREVREETLATVVSARLVHEAQSDDGHFVRTYACELEDRDVAERSTPEGQVRWVKPEEIVKGCFSTYNTAAMKAARIDTSGEEPCLHEEEVLHEVRVTVCLACGHEVSRD